MLVALLMGTSLVACGATLPAPDLTGTIEDLVGSWELESAEFDEGSVSENDLQEMESYGMRCTLDVDDDGTLLIDAFGQQQTGTWEIKDEQTISLTLEGESVDVPRPDEQLTIVYDGETLVFAKTSDKPVMDRDPSENAGELGGMDGLEDITDDDGALEPTEFSDLFSEEVVLWQRLYAASVEVDVPLDIVVADDDTALVKVTGIGVDTEGDTGYLVSVENRTDTDFVLTNVTTTLDGVDVYDYATLLCTVRAGESVDGFFNFDHEAAVVSESSSAEVMFAALDIDQNPLGIYSTTI